MITDNTLAVIYGLTSAASWGAGDFSGGVASKRSRVFRVIFTSQVVGVVMLAMLALVLDEPMPSSGLMFTGGLAGLSGMIGLVALYRGLSLGRMGLVAPIAAVITAVIPLIGSTLIEGLPSILQLAGFAFALTAVYLLTREKSGGPIRRRVLLLPVVAGLGFGVFFILIDQVSDEAVLWPLVAARLSSLTLLVLLILTGRAGRQAPGIKHVTLIALAGVCDAGGNAFFALATRVGRLDVAAVTSSLYPAATVLLAMFLLKERLGHMQWAGLMMAVVAIALITT